MEKLLEKYKLAKQQEEKRLQKQISEINEKISFYNNQIKYIDDYIRNFRFDNFNQKQDFIVASTYIDSLRKQKEKYIEEVKKLNSHLNELLDKLAEIYAEKKAIDKSIKNLEKQKQIKIQKLENSIADEIFIRKFVNNQNRG